MDERIHIRWMIRSDMPSVYVSEHSLPHPWNEDCFLAFLRQRDCIGMVGELQGKIVSHMVYRIKKDRIVIARFVVHPLYRHQGFGTQMMDKLKAKLTHQRRKMLHMRVRESDTGMQLFCRKNGWLAVKVTRNYYVDEDAYCFSYRLPAPNMVESNI